jgi:hypothetical protein
VLKKLIGSIIERLLWRVITKIVNKVLDKDAQNIPRELRRRSRNESADFVWENMPLVEAFPDRFALLAHALESAPSNGLILEFGVFQATSLNFIASKIGNRTAHGFDSFEGLPEHFTNEYKQGHFSTAQPTVGSNVTLVAGWFDDSIPKFTKENQDPVAFMHIDCDLYSSTKTVFDGFRDNFVDGTVLVFDEFFNFPGWQGAHEHKALMEFIESTGAQIEYLGYCSEAPPVAIRLRFPGK